jgi:hypothetical protein
MKAPLSQKLDTTKWPEWLQSLKAPWEQMQRYLALVFQKNITFEDNIRCQIKELTFTTSAAYGTPPVLDNFVSIPFASTLDTPARAFLLVSINEFSGAPVTGAVSMAIRDDNGTIRISYITGLEVSTKYTIRILLF